MNDDANKFLTRLLGFSLGPIISAVIGFVTTPITTWLIAPEEFGKSSMYTMAISLAALFIYLGLDQSFVREYNKEKNKNNLIWNTFIIPFIFSWMVLIIALYYWQSISFLLFNSFDFFIILVLVFSLPLMVFDKFNLLIIRMEEKAKLYSLLTIIPKIINLPMVIILLFFYEKSFKSIIIAQFLSLFLSVIISFIINRKKWMVSFSFDKRLMLRSLRFGLPLVPAAVFAWLLNSMDKVAIRTWSNFNELGLYSAAFKIVMLLEIMKTSFSTFWSPTAYRWYEEGVSNEKFEKVSQKSSVVFFLTFGVIVLFKDLIMLIFDSSYHEASVIIPFLLFSPIMYSLTEVTKKGIDFSRKSEYTVMISGVAAFMNFFGNYLLVPTMGGLGAAISTAFSFVIYFFGTTLISRKLWFKFDLKFYIINIMLMIIMATVSVFFHSVIVEMIILIIIIIYNYYHIKYMFILGINLSIGFTKRRDQYN